MNSFLLNVIQDSNSYKEQLYKLNLQKQLKQEYIKTFKGKPYLYKDSKGIYHIIKESISFKNWKWIRNNIITKSEIKFNGIFNDGTSKKEIYILHESDVQIIHQQQIEKVIESYIIQLENTIINNMIRKVIYD